MDHSPLVEVCARDAVATVVIENPPINALSEEALAQLVATTLRLGADARVRAVVLTGAGSRSFAAGADICELREPLDGAARVTSHVRLTRRALDTLAALQPPRDRRGRRLGGRRRPRVGARLDLAVAGGRTQLGLPEVGRGVMPRAGGTQRLPRRIGHARAAELILLDRLMSAAEAHRIGLVSAAVPAGKALERAAELADRLAIAVRAAKRAIREGAELPLPAALDAEHHHFAATLATADARVGVAASLERRRPEFSHP